MAHQRYAVGVKTQAPLLFVLAATGPDLSARVSYSEIVGRLTAVGPSTALRPVWSRVTVPGVGPTTVTPEPLNAFGVASAFQGEHTYGVDPTCGLSTEPYPLDRNAYAQRVRYPEGSGPYVLDGCPLAVQAGATGNWVWDVNVVFEEL
jgi:hypothetical protein